IAHVEKAGTVYVPAADQVGTVWNLLDGSAAVANSYEYDAFGVGRAAGETAPNRYRFGTKRLDEDTELYHFIARQYEPKLGRFASRDMFRYLGCQLAAEGRLINQASAICGGCSAYVFVGNVPLSTVDPRGFWDQRVHYEMTRKWAVDVGYDGSCAQRLAQADNNVDSIWGGSAPKPGVGDFRYHFDSNKTGTARKPGARKDRYDYLIAELKKTCNTNQIRKALRLLGKALHPMQDRYSHQWGGAGATDNSGGHMASMPFEHAPQVYCAAFGDPLGEKLLPCIRAREHIPNWRNPYRPDSVTLFPPDVGRTGSWTRKELKRWLEECCVIWVHCSRAYT
ncbi:MAG: RHS repeat-associated core domain-containing protein, partial [Candidatus Brocadiia bacterium]